MPHSQQRKKSHNFSLVHITVSCCKLYALMAIGGQQILELLARVLLGVDGINRLILSLLLV